MPTTLVALLLVSGTDAYRSTSQCLQSLSRELAAAAACGHEGSLNYCLSNLPEAAYDAPKPSAALSHLQDCFVNAGCTDAEAQIEAVWTLRRCQSPGELRVRADRGGSGNSGGDDEEDGGGDEEETPTRHHATKTTEKQKEKTTEKTTEKTEKPTEKAKEKTTEKTTEPETTATPEPTTPSAVARTTPTTDSTTSTTSQNVSPQEAIVSGRPTQCLATSMVDISVCPTQSTGANSGSKLPCFPTKAAASACAAGLICATGTGGDVTCMFAHNGLDAGGVFVALFFSAAVAASVFFMIFFCCRERREQRKLAKAAEAAAIAREVRKGKAPAVAVSVSAVPPLPSSAPNVEAGRPLLEQDVAGAPQQQNYGLPAGYHDPFADQHHMDQHQMR